MADKGSEKLITMCVPAEVEFLHVIRYVVRSAALEFGFSIDDAAKIEMAADEACTNVMLHGYPGEETAAQSVYVNLEFASDRMVVKIVDRARAFSPLSHQDISVEDHIRKGQRGGLGIYIMKSFMDEVNHHYDDDGNQLELVKLLPTASHSADVYP